MLEAKRHWDAGESARAATLYDLVSEKYPGSREGQEALYLAGSLRAFYLNEPEAGAERFARLIAKYPKFSRIDEARLRLGELYLGGLEKPEDSARVYQDLADNGASDDLRNEGRYRLGQSLVASGKYDLARHEWEGLLEQEKGGRWAEKARFAYAVSFDKEQKTIEAMKSYQDFVAAYPKSSNVTDAQIAIADCLDRLDRPQEGLALLKSISEGVPENEIIRARIGRLKKRIRMIGLMKK
jgi:TolA-binding protein